MASYYSGNSEIQGGDGLQTLVLMNPGYVNYSDHQQQPPQPPPPAGNFMFLNNHEHTSQTQQHFVGIPLSQHDNSAVHPFMPRLQYMYNPVELAAAPPHEVARFQQGLSLTLSSQQPGFGSGSGSQSAGVPTTAEGRVQPGGGGGGGGGGGSTASASGISNGVNSVILNSKYLKATHELLEEVVNVGKDVFKSFDQSTKNLITAGSGSGGGGSPAETNGEERRIKGGDGAEVSTAERQEVQMKKAKLVNMLDEVEQRYRQYHNQMQIVISWFEQASGIGSAKTYTALALQTISKQFRCLKDAIIGQIKTASRNLGEDDNKIDGGSRLKFVDNQIRQQRALQQLGMIQHNAWRPQRGLPERSVSVLRAWLFEHFLHPYPKDSDKHLLAKQTGLTRSQVSNWFINARVRLWKPMVEEMYLEEIKEQEHNKFDENKASKSEQSEENEDSSSKQENSKSQSPENSKRGFNHLPPPPMSDSTAGSSFQNHSGFAISSQMDGITQFSLKKPRTNVTFTPMGNSNPTDFMGGLGGYPMAEIGRFGNDQFQSQYSGNGVSLTLGLPNENIGGGMELGEANAFEPMNQQSSSHSSAIYETMNIQNQKRFAAQPMPDFVT